MFVLDGHYTSELLLDFLEESGEPVLDNQAARSLAQTRRLNLADRPQPGERIIAASEMHLDQVKAICPPETARAIDLCKDKAAMREALRPLYPGYAFREYTAGALHALDPATIPYPVVLKPVTGFFSLGIYPIFCPDDWNAALADIAAHSPEWEAAYTGTVVNDSRFLVESYIEGDEFALDAYLDDAGEPVILNIFAHAFADANDTSDRLYYTSKDVMGAQLHRMEAWLREVNGLLGFHSFPMHIEVRVTPEGEVVPIEFNPLRFAGLCNTDLAQFAWDIRTYEWFLSDRRPDWLQLLEGTEGRSFAMIILQQEGFDPSLPHEFDYGAATAGLSHVLDLRKLDYTTQGAFCFIFAEVRDENWDTELEPLLNAPLDPFIHYLEPRGNEREDGAC